MSKSRKIASALFGAAATFGFGMIITDSYAIYGPMVMSAIAIPAMWVWMRPD